MLYVHGADRPGGRTSLLVAATITAEKLAETKLKRLATQNHALVELLQAATAAAALLKTAHELPESDRGPLLLIYESDMRRIECELRTSRAPPEGLLPHTSHASSLPPLSHQRHPPSPLIKKTSPLMSPSASVHTYTISLPWPRKRCVLPWWQKAFSTASISSLVAMTPTLARVVGVQFSLKPAVPRAAWQMHLYSDARLTASFARPWRSCHLKSLRGSAGSLRKYVSYRMDADAVVQLPWVCKNMSGLVQL